MHYRPSRAPICDGRCSDFSVRLFVTIGGVALSIGNDEAKVRSVPSASHAHRQVALQDEMGCHNPIKNGGSDDDFKSNR